MGLLNENIEKNKKFLIKVMGHDFTDNIKMITSKLDVPREFDEGIFIDYSKELNKSWDLLSRMLNFFGPMYLVKINGENYLYQDRGDFEWFINKQGFDFVDDEIIEELKISEMGLRFSDIINMFFKEE